MLVYVLTTMQGQQSRLSPVYSWIEYEHEYEYEYDLIHSPNPSV